MEKRVKTIIRTVSKRAGFANPADGLYSNSEVEDYVSKFVNDGWVVMKVEVLEKDKNYLDVEHAAMDIMYILSLPDSAYDALQSEKKMPAKRGRPRKTETE